MSATTRAPEKTAEPQARAVEALPSVNLEEKLFTIRYKADHASHLAIRDHALCAACSRPCESFCPARVWEWKDDEGRMQVAFENCLECGTCRLACPEQNIEWRYPTGGTGIAYRFG